MLFARERGPSESHLVPLLCLAGLTRNSKDFEPLGAKLPNRQIIAFDYRGRGRSQYADHDSYTPKHELEDAIALLDYLKIPRICVVGTSRGGIIAMLMAQRHGARIAGAVLNDIGPRLEKDGLIRIARLIRERPEFRSWTDAADGLRARNPEMTGLRDNDWLRFARRLYKEEAGSIVPDHDPSLALTFPSADELARAEYPQLWTQFGALQNKPCAVLRGEFSDLLSEETVRDMSTRHKGLIAVSIRGRGHVPFLDEPESVAAVELTATRCDSYPQ
jgi:pimeloyl-ACP methyl ester carboxylesterase